MHKTIIKFLLLTSYIGIKGNIYICATHTRKNFEVIMLHLILKKLANIVTVSAAQAHKLHMPSVQYSVLDHRPHSLSVQPPPHTLDQLAAVVLLPAAVGERMSQVWSSAIGAC